jgi:hypothetical protein
MTETSATRTETNRHIICQAFDAWRRGTGAIIDVFPRSESGACARC